MKRSTLLSFFIVGALASAVLASPSSAAPAGRPDRKAHRIFDPAYRDYHVWDGREERAYRHYLEERHDPYRDWAKARAKQRLEYWKWRHSHSNRE